MRKYKYLRLALLLSGVLTACGNNNRSTGRPAEPAIAVSEQPLKGCYLGVLKKDSIQLAITAVEGKNIKGSLLFNFFEKDRSRGTIKGTYSNGILLADYTFQSEGMTSVRQVIFKKTADGFVEGFGSTKMAGEKEVFVDTASVDYSQPPLLSRSDNCLP